MTGKGRYWIENDKGHHELRCVFPMCSPEDEKLAVLKPVKPDSWVYTVTIPGFPVTGVLTNLSLEDAKLETERVVGNHMGFQAEYEKTRYEIFGVENTDAAATASLSRCALMADIRKLYDTYGKERVLSLIADKKNDEADEKAGRKARHAEIAADCDIGEP